MLAFLLMESVSCGAKRSEASLQLPLGFAVGDELRRSFAPMKMAVP
jgi:hypothetical protein